MIEAKWISVSEELPPHNTRCVVGNVNESDTRIKAAVKGPIKFAIYIDTAQEPESFPAVMSMKRVPMKGFIILGTDEWQPRPVEQFTHWWPIPPPITGQWPEPKL